MLQPQPVQALQEHIPLPGVQRGQLLVIGLREADSHAGGLLKGGGGPDGEEIVDLFGVLNDLRWADEIAQPPAGDGVGLGQGGAGQRPVPHPRQGGEVGVPVGGVDDVLIHLIGDDVGVVLGGHLRNGQQLLPGEDPAAGVGGVAQHQSLGTLAEGSLQLVHVEAQLVELVDALLDLPHFVRVELVGVGQGAPQRVVAVD